MAFSVFFGGSAIYNERRSRRILVAYFPKPWDANSGISPGSC